jgi:hypothetical protein
MFKIGDKFTVSGALSPDRQYVVTEVAEVYEGKKDGLLVYGQILSHANGIWILDTAVTKVNPLKTYRVYKEVQAESEDAARRMLGESFSVQEV